MAFRDGEKSDRAMVGAYLLADVAAGIREIAGFLGGVGRGRER